MIVLLLTLQRYSVGWLVHVTFSAPEVRPVVTHLNLHHMKTKGLAIIFSTFFFAPTEHTQSEHLARPAMDPPASAKAHLLLSLFPTVQQA
jgi:hypothetical protein